MALTGHLSDLSLSELIEFFCNQRKVGLLCVHYPQGSGYFFLQHGSVVDAKIGVLQGIDAVYYALTLPNAAFEFKAAAEPPERTINQPWTQVVLEGLRRLDEGIEPAEAFVAAPAAAAPAAAAAAPPKAETVNVDLPPRASNDNRHVPAFLSPMKPTSLGHRKPIVIGLAATAVLISVAVIGVPAGWYARAKAPVPLSQPSPPSPSAAQPEEVKQPATPQPNSSEADAHSAEAAALLAKRQKEKDRAKAREDRNSAATAAAQVPPSGNETKPGARKVTVQVTYDESGRVIQASGADPTALRVARQKRFPPGKGGTATITIPIN
jgi:Domain of unknown function (DUF4388)